MEKKVFLTQKGPKAVGPYSTAVVYGDTIYMSGMIPINPASGMPVRGSIEEQTHQVMKNIETVLQELGRSMADIIKTTIYVVDLNDFKTVNEIYKSYFSSDYPARTTVQIAKLPLDVSIEIEVIVANKK